MTITHQTRVYLHGAVAAAINSGASGFVLIMADPDKFNLSDAQGIKHLLLVSLATAAFGFMTYIKDHPLPQPEDVDYASAQSAAIAKIGSTGDGTVKVTEIIKTETPQSVTNTATQTTMKGDPQ